MYLCSCVSTTNYSRPSILCLPPGIQFAILQCTFFYSKPPDTGVMVRRMPIRPKIVGIFPLLEAAGTGTNIVLRCTVPVDTGR
jgi:hypothetical protein